MAKEDPVEIKDNPISSDLVVSWLKRRFHLFNASKLAKEIGLTVFRINNLMDGRSVLDERKAREVLRWISELSEMQVKVEEVKKKPQIDGWISTDDNTQING